MSSSPRFTDSPVREPADRWTTAEAAELYDVASWGKGYFSVGKNGHLLVHPEKDTSRAIDLKELVDNLQLRGISLPILIRFGEILKHRLGEMHQAFQNAIAEHGYKNSYCCVYPIKVNQQRQVVEEVFEYGRPYKFGLEAGSKPELLAVLAIADNQTPIICNGFKDDEYIEMVMLAKKIGRNIIPVVEKYTELDLILKHSQRVGVRPVIGLRVKLASRGSGRWKSSGGYRSKFGLTVTEALRALEQLKAVHMEDCLELLHFHLGSQITNIRQIKGAVMEAARVLRGTAPRRRRAALYGRRRRPGHRLRRLADGFRIERQLHAAGIRQRRRVSHPEHLRRSRGAASDHRFGKRPRGGRVSQRAGVQRPGRHRIRRQRYAARNSGGRRAAADRI